MKKKFILLTLLFVGIFCFSACGKGSSVDLNQYLIEQRETLYTGNNELYTVTYSGGMREENYSLDGTVNPLTPFGVITLTRTDGEPLANDTYTYTVTINEENFTGTMQKYNDFSYCADLETNAPADAIIKVKIDFTGYSFASDLTNVSSTFGVNKAKAIEIANSELADNLKNILSQNGTKIEVITKVLQDYSSSEVNSYYWYVGVISTNGETLGILINANDGSIIAKKV